MNSVDVDPVQECQDRLAAMRAGRSALVLAEEAEQGLQAARMDLGVGWGGRRVGWGLMKTGELNGGGDWQEAWFAISDGERDGAVLTSLNASDVAAASNRGEDPIETLTEVLRQMLLPSSVDHFDHIALSHPIRL